MKARKKESRKAAEAAPRRGRTAPNCGCTRSGWPFGLFAAFQAYAPALYGPFLFDDLYLPMNAPGAAHMPLLDWMKGVRPLLMFTYWVNYQLSGLNTASYHAWNVVFHFLNGLLVYFIVRKLLQLAGERSAEPGA